MGVLTRTEALIGFELVISFITSWVSFGKFTPEVL